MSEPTSVDIRGVDVKFPFTPYSVQSVFMEKVMEALQDKKNALLESPTGTGKTFSLLCSTLAWAEAEANRVHYRDVKPMSAVKHEEHGGPSSKGANFVPPELYRRPRPRIVYASRTHSQLAQVAQELKRTAYRPTTVVLGSRAQLCSNPKVREKGGSSNAAISTQCQSLRSAKGCHLHRQVDDFVSTMRAQLSSLSLRSSSSSSASSSVSASLALAKQENEAGSKWKAAMRGDNSLTADKLVRQGPPLTQTTILDIEELKMACRQSGKPACPYYAAKKLCADADVVLLPYNYLLEPSIRASLGITLKDAVIIIDEGHNVPGVCMDAGSFDLTAAELAQAMRDMDDLAKLLKTKPNERIEVKLAAAAGSATTPTGNNSGAGPGSSNSGGQTAGQTTIVVTLADVAAMKKCVYQLEMLLNKWFTDLGGDTSGRARKSGTAAGDGGVTRPGHEIHQLFKEAFQSKGKMKRLADTLEAFTLALAGSDTEAQFPGGQQQSVAAANAGSTPLPAPSSNGSGVEERQSTAMKELANALAVVHRTPPELAGRVYRMHLAPADKDKVMSEEENGSSSGRFKAASKVGVTLHFWCFDPSIAMASLLATEPNSLILTSGTLAPLESFAAELGVPFPVRLESPHVIPSDQILVSVCGMGPDGSQLKATYNERSTPQFLRALGNTVINVIRHVPHGVLVFFPSYSMMTDTLEWWKVSESQANTSSLELRQSRFQRGGGGGRGWRATSAAAAAAAGTGGANYFESHTSDNRNSIWNRIRKLKKPIVEPTSSAQLNSVMQTFYDALAHPGDTTGAIFFAVCRGKVAEGIDFSNDNARAVLVVGMPFASLYDPWVKEKRAYQDRMHSRTGNSSGGGSSSTLFSQSSGGGKQLAAAAVPQQIDGQTWYTQEAIRAVNQAIGRVIRHRNDYGAILLCDPRFNQTNVARQLSKWIQQHCFAVRSFGEVVRPLCKFYRRMGEHSFDDAAATVSSSQDGAGVDRKPDRKPGSSPNKLSVSYERSSLTASNEHGSSSQQRPFSSSQSESAIDNLRASAAAADLASASPLLASILGKAQGNATAAVAAVVASGSVVGDQKAAEQAAVAVMQSSRSSASTEAAASVSAKKDPKRAAIKFLEELKVEADRDTFAEFRNSMALYKDPKVDFGLAQMVEKARSLFSRNPKLLLGFLDFLPSKHRPQYEQVFRDDIAAMLYNGTGDSWPRPRPSSSRPESGSASAVLLPPPPSSSPSSVSVSGHSPQKRRRIKTFDLVTGKTISKKL